MNKIKPDQLYWFTSSSGKIEFTMPGEAVLDIAQPGPADAAVAWWKAQPELAQQLAQIDRATLASELSEYGAWDDVELSGHEDNLDRIVWLAAGDISDSVYSCEDGEGL